MRGKGALGSSASEVFQMGPEGNPTFTAPSSMPEALATSQLLTKALGWGVTSLHPGRLTQVQAGTESV